MTPEVRDWLTRHELVAVDGKVPLQVLLDVPEGLFPFLQAKHADANGFQVASMGGLVLCYWCRRHKDIPVITFPTYEVRLGDTPVHETQVLEEALEYIRGLVEKGLRA